MRASNDSMMLSTNFASSSRSQVLSGGFRKGADLNLSEVRTSVRFALPIIALADLRAEIK